jgi:hypothetical protein
MSASQPTVSSSVTSVGAAARHIRAIRLWLAIFIAGLVLSGVTAFPLETELRSFLAILHAGALKPIAQSTHLLPWIPWLDHVYTALAATNSQYPFLAYGTDWLAFAHLVLAIAFIGPWRDPVRNRWLFTFGLIACAGVIPLALIAGPIRGIPLPWRLIDCSFGVLGCIPLLLCKKHLRALEDAQSVSEFTALAR